MKTLTSKAITFILGSLSHLRLNALQLEFTGWLAGWLVGWLNEMGECTKKSLRLKKYII